MSTSRTRATARTPNGSPRARAGQQPEARPARRVPPRRRGVVTAVLALAFAPAAHAAHSARREKQTAGSGAAPLTVTLTACCASTTYAWNFGDGATAVGQTV